MQEKAKKSLANLPNPTPPINFWVVSLLTPVGQNGIVTHNPYFSNKFFNFAYKQITKWQKEK
jgi:hypothetical protein